LTFAAPNPKQARDIQLRRGDEFEKPFKDPFAASSS
jgi:hypothetical protein